MQYISTAVFRRCPTSQSTATKTKQVVVKLQQHIIEKTHSTPSTTNLNNQRFTNLFASLSSFLWQLSRRIRKQSDT